MASQTVPTRRLGGVEVPDTPLITAAIAFAKSHLSELSFNHVMRSFLFGFILAAKNPSAADRDLEVHAISAILHDMGWDATGRLVSRDKRFEVDGAIAAREFLQENAPDWDRRRVQLVWDAIALHTTFSIAAHKEVEVGACSNGIVADFVGPMDGRIEREEYDAVVREFPRLNFTDGAVEIFCGLCKTKPETTYDNFLSQVGEAYVDGYKPNRSGFVDMLKETRKLDSM